MVLSLAWLHAVAVVPLHAPHLYGIAAKVLPVDLLATIAVVVFGGALGRPRAAAHFAAGGLLVSTISRSCEQVSVLVFGKDFELEDVAQLWAIFDAWANKAAVWERCCVLGALLICGGLVYWVTYRAFRAVSRSATRRLSALLWCGVLGAVLTAALLGPQPVLDQSPLATLGVRSVDAFRRWGDRHGISGLLVAEVARGERRMEQTPHDLSALGGVDVHLLVLESYGRVALRHPALRVGTRRVYAELEDALREGGLSVCSAAVAPAVRGGRSGLAHAELLTGVPVASEQMREKLMQSDLVALPQRFRGAGYRTVEVLPGMPIHWPEGDAFYGVDRSIVQPELGYEGVQYDFGAMPDQFALHRLLEEVVAPAQQPLFTMFVGVSSHAPWSAVPPFVPDWDVDRQTYAAGPARRHDTSYQSMLSDPDVLPAYFDSIEYVLKTSVGFALQLSRPSVVVVLGDHQPPIAGALSPPDVSHDVPVHVISTRPELLQALLESGFVDGLDLPDQLPAAPMAGLAPALLASWSR